MSGYRGDVFRGIRWLGFLRVVTRVVTLVKTAILARILTPTDFGQFGIAALALALFETLTETGINQALIQSDRKVEDVADSAWVISIVRGTLIAMFILLAAFPLARFFHDPTVFPLILMIAFVPFIKGFINPMEVVFLKELNFSTEVKFRSILLVFDAAAATIAAVMTRSAVAFVAALLLSGVLEVFLSFRWFPTRPHFRFQPRHLREILGYGKWITLSGFASWVSSQLDDLVVGRVFGTLTLGVYQAAYKISTLPVTEIAGTINQATFPVLSKIKHDSWRLMRVFWASLGLGGSIGAVVSGVLLVFPSLAVGVLLGPQWAAAVPLIRLLAIFGLIRTIESGLQPLFLATNRPYIASWGNVLKVVVLVAGLLAWTGRGVTGVVWAVLASGFSIIPYYFWRLTDKNAA